MLLYVIFVLLLLWLILYVIARFIKYSFSYEQSIHIEVPPSMLWPIMINHAKEKDWRNNVLEVVKMPNIDGKAVWKEIHRNKEVFMLQTLLSDTSQFTLERKIINHKKYGGTYYFQITEDEGGSRLTIKHEGEVYNAHAKLRHILFPRTKTNFVRQYLSDVKQRAIHVREERDGLLE